MKRGHQAAGGRDGFHGLSPANMHVGLAVGDDKKRSVFQLVLHVDVQPFRRPERFGGLPQPGFSFRRRAAAARLRVKCVTSCINGSIKIRSREVRPVRGLARPQFSHPLCRAGDGPAMLQRTISSVASVMNIVWMRTRRRVTRQI